MTSTDFNLLLVRHREYLAPFAISLTQDGIDAQDLCQETMLRALTNHDKYQFGTNLKAWLFTIMRNIFINSYRKQKRYQHTGLTADWTDEISMPGLVTYNKAFEHMRLMEIKAAIDRLPKPFRLSFELYYVGYKYQEIAEIMNEPLGTIKSRIHFARKALTAQLDR